MPGPDDGVARRLAALRRLLRRRELDGLLVTGVHNVGYLTGFTGEDSAALFTADEAFFLTDGRYTEQASRETRGLAILQRRRGLMELAGRTAARLGLRRLGFEPDRLTVQQHTDLGRRARGVELVPQRGVIEEMRQVKEAGEIRVILKAIRIAEEAFGSIRAAIRPGRTERELAHMLDAAMVRLGADGAAFPTIVAAGERTSLPHARPTTRAIRSGDAVLFDWGARFECYTSDLTRTVFVDRISPFFEALYRVVLDAQRRALRSVRPGRTADRIDQAARDCIKAARHGKHFGHGLGHGTGREVHELPVLNARSKAVLRPRMVFTVEPGVYLPGRGGVRIEDDVLVTRDGCRVLTTTPKSLRDVIVRS